MIDAQHAVLLAKDKAEEMLGPSPSYLEEIERESYKDREVWSITLSFPQSPDKVPIFERLNALSVYPLQYKRFIIDVETGELVAMRLREVAVQ
ncbi:MAG TPA: hypothetical protein VGR73_14735 [Bryobacteraceae bacterium]|nr:hypothetical protein [Bryobacteraceae bacterium]